MKKEWLVKTLALGIIVLFIGVTITPTIGMPSYFDDIIPPVTTISFDPLEPNGENGWYVSNVNVTLNASDDNTGVNITKYRINGGIWYNYTELFILDADGEDILIEFYSIDYAGNQEEVKSFEIDIDKTKPLVSLTYEVIGENQSGGWDLRFWATAVDDTSGMNRVEFFENSILQCVGYGPGPSYYWNMVLYPNFLVFGLIRDLNISEDFIKFFSIIIFITWNYPVPDIKVYAYDNAGNWAFDEIEHPTFYPPDSGIYLFQNFTFINNYKGYIGKFFIKARFYSWDII